MKKLFYVLVMAMLCSAFVGCAKEDEVKQGYGELIVGVWLLDKEYNGVDNSYSDGENTIAEFKSDGRCFFEYDDGTKASTKWSISNATLYFEQTADKDSESYKITKLDKNELVLDRIEHGTTGVTILYLTRIK